MEKDYSSIERVRVSKVKIKIEKLYKIFGPKAKEMTQEVKNGIDKDELLAKYNHVLGLDNINLDIEDNILQFKLKNSKNLDRKSLNLLRKQQIQATIS